MSCLVYTYIKKVTQEKAACFLVLAAVPWAGYKFLKEARWLLLGKENGQQGPAPGPHSGPGREGKMLQSAVPWRRQKDAPGCRHTDKLQQQRGQSFLKTPEETEGSVLASQ